MKCNSQNFKKSQNQQSVTIFLSGEETHKIHMLCLLEVDLGNSFLKYQVAWDRQTDGQTEVRTELISLYPTAGGVLQLGTVKDKSQIDINKEA